MPVSMMAPLARARGLLPLGFALLACACDTSGFVEASTEEHPLTLDAAQPHVVKRLRLRGGTRDKARAKFTGVSLVVSTSVRWWPGEETRTDVLPWYRLRVVSDPDGEVQDELTLVMKPFSHFDSLYLGASTELAAPTDSVDTTFRLEFDRQGAPSEGALDVKWKAYATLYKDAGDPEDLQFTLTEEPE